MDSYLSIAEKVLAEAEMPLSAKEILRRAYLADLVPGHLYGKTQHKTLQARISEDIRASGQNSAFYRVERGVFFLSRLRNSPALTDKQRQGFNARPRFRELNRKPVLAVLNSIVRQLVGENPYLPISDFKTVLSFETTAYKKLKAVKASHDYPVWAFLVVKKDDMVLSYRHGSYRENRDGFLNQRTIGFSTLLTADDATFFEQEDFGLITAGLRSVFVDLGVPLRSVDLNAERRCAKMEFVSVFNEGDNSHEIVCVVTYKCPDWLEPLKKRLAINDVSWLTATHVPNHLDDFDEWSKKIIPKLFSDYKTSLRRANEINPAA